jgi:formylmethanofuran:tetrahydromethanopterin formyltransferase
VRRRAADKKFKNKMSRVIIACQDGGRRTELACDMVTKLGYTAIIAIEGGVEAYVKVSPWTEADKRPRVKRVEQQVGIKYGGTGVTSDQTPDDSA